MHAPPVELQCRHAEVQQATQHVLQDLRDGPEEPGTQRNRAVKWSEGNSQKPPTRTAAQLIVDHNVNKAKAGFVNKKKNFSIVTRKEIFT